MDPRLIVASAVAAVTVGSAVRNSVKTVREERAKRAEIRRQRDKELLAINAASATILERMNHKTYASPQALLDDLEFEMIRHYNKD